MMDDQKNKKAITGGSLRATAVEFTPSSCFVTGAYENPVYFYPDADTCVGAVGRPDATDVGHPISCAPVHTYAVTTTTKNRPNEGAGILQSQTRTTNDSGRQALGSAKLECPLCFKLGDILPCCDKRTSPCPHCARLIHENEQRDSEVAGLHAKIAQLEAETPEDKYKRLCAEKNAKIEQLKAKVDTVRKDDEQLQKEVKEREKTLSRLRNTLEAKKPKQEKERRQEFFIKEAKVKKGKQ
jgi:outer membrane murein-binding lipoprotein Lpp